MNEMRYELAARERQRAAQAEALAHVIQLKPDPAALIRILCVSAPAAVLDGIHQLAREAGGA